MQIFTDGSVAGHIAGIAFVLTDNDYNIILAKKKPVLNIDNNSAELQAILFALEELPNAKDVFPPKPGETPQETAERIRKESEITIFTDSTYARDSILYDQPRDCDRATLELINFHLITRNCTTVWTKGHRNDGTKSAALNRWADHMAKEAGKSFAIVRKHLRETGQYIPSSPKRRKRQDAQNPPTRKQKKLIERQSQIRNPHRNPPRNPNQGRNPH